MLMGSAFTLITNCVFIFLKEAQSTQWESNDRICKAHNTKGSKALIANLYIQAPNIDIMLSFVNMH
jgi:hypothetical protein